MNPMARTLINAPTTAKRGEVIEIRALVLSRRPARIAGEHAIPIPRPRNIRDIFTLPGFAAIHQRIRADVQ